MEIKFDQIAIGSSEFNLKGETYNPDWSFEQEVEYQMPIFMDTHKVPFTKQHLQELCASPRYEFGVAHVDLLFNKDANVCFCVLDAPNEEAVRKHHEKANVDCEWIIQVETAKTQS